jgi:hypothetical protein
LKRVSLAAAAAASLIVGVTTVSSAPSLAATTTYQLAGTSSPVAPGVKLTARYAVRSSSLRAGVEPAGTQHLLTYTRNVTDGASTFSVTQVGRNPFVVQSLPSSSVQMPIIPVIFNMGSVVFDPTVAHPGCASSAATTLTMSSPVVKTGHDFKVGTTDLGKSQYVDFFQRANYWQQVTTINPGYHDNVKGILEAPITVNVPLNTYGSGCGTLGMVDYGTWANLVESTLFHTVLTPLGFGPKSFPLFLFYNVVLWSGSLSTCCVLGYHGAFNNPDFANVAQTYGVADFDMTGDFGPNTSDIGPMSHEVAEWMNDPWGNNPTKPWGHIGQVSGCQGNLEVGDPLSGTSIPVTLAHFTYHPQELAFTSWFYHQSPSTGVNGLYSSNGTFTSSAAPCP